MVRIKRNLAWVPAVLAAAFLTLPAGPLARADTTRLEFTRVFLFVNPCNGEVIHGVGDTRISYTERRAADGTRRYILRHGFDGTGVGSQGNAYDVHIRAVGVFDAPTGHLSPPNPRYGYLPYFDVPFRGSLVAQAGKPAAKGESPGKSLNADIEGYQRVVIYLDSPYDSQTLAATSTCRG